MTVSSAGSRLQGTALVGLCAVGMALGLLLTVSESGRREPVEVSAVHDTRTGGVISVTATLSNTTNGSRCPDVRAVARDGDAKDLVEVEAEAADGSKEIAAHQTRRYAAVLKGLSKRDIDEKLHDVTIYVYEPHRC